MSEYNERRRFLQQMLALVATGIALEACGGKAKEVPPSPSPTQSAPQQEATPLPSPTSAGKPQESPAPSATTAPSATSAPAAAAAPAATKPPAATAAPSPIPASPTASIPDLVIARGAGADPAELTRRAVAAVGGIERFVKKGADVIVKPNICVAYHGPEYAATTNPQVVAAVVAMCLSAGASRVRVMDLPFGGTAQNAYARSGIAEAVTAAGGQMELMNRMRYRNLDIPSGRKIKKWTVYGDALDADVLINIPIAKDHGSSGLTLGMKNLMGLVQDRNSFHARGLHQCIADLSSALRPQLVIVDAVRILLRNGPTGGNLNDVKRTDTVIASTDPVAADSYATTLFGMTGKDIGYIKLAAEMGLGQIDLGKLQVAEVQV